MKKMFFLLLLILNIGCTGQNDKNGVGKYVRTDNSFYTLDFSSMLKKQREVPLSEIAQSVEYIPLETKAESVLGRISYAKFTDEFIFIKHSGTPLLTQFSRNGKFIRQIGKEGKGPGEFLLIRTCSFDEENRLIHIQSNYKSEVLVYNFEGKYLKTIPFKKELGKLNWVRNNSYINYTEPFNGNEKFLFSEINSNGDVIQAVNNDYTWKKTTQGFTSNYRDQTFFYLLTDCLHFKGRYNDTIYTYDSKDKIIPKFYIDLKKYKLPNEMRPERGLVKKMPSENYWVSVKESSKYVFIRYSTYEPIEDKGPFLEGYMIYDKSTGIGNAIGKKGRKIEFVNDIGEFGFENDIDGGPDLIPEYTTNSLAFNFISAMELKKYLASDKFIKSIPRDPNKKTKLINQMKELKETDNDVLMVVNLK